MMANFLQDILREAGNEAIEAIVIGEFRGGRFSDKIPFNVTLSMRGRKAGSITTTTEGTAERNATPSTLGRRRESFTSAHTTVVPASQASPATHNCASPNTAKETNQ